MGLRWYVARTEPRAEFIAAEVLARDGYDVFLPRVKSLLSRVGQSDVPLFPGYLFLRYDRESQGWPAFRPGHRIIGWVTFGGEIPWLPDEIVASIMDRSEAINRQGGIWRRFRTGEKVQVVSPIFEGMAEVIREAKSPQASVQVLLQFMGGLVRAEVPLDNLRPIENQAMGRSQTSRRTRGKGRWVRAFRPAPGLTG